MFFVLRFCRKGERCTRLHAFEAKIIISTLARMEKIGELSYTKNEKEKVTCMLVTKD